MTRSSAETVERMTRAKSFAYRLYVEFGEIGAREYIKNMIRNASSEDVESYWWMVDNYLSAYLRPVHHKPKPYVIHKDQLNLEKKRVV